MAIAKDAAENPLVGNPGWQLEGENAGIGAAVGYTVGFGVPGQELVARLGNVEARRTIYAEADSVGADDDGCSQGGHAPVAAAVACLGVFGRRKGRRQGPRRVG